MKILLLSWNFPPTIGGIEQVAGNLVRELARAGHEVRVLTRRVADAPAQAGVERARGAGLPRYLAFALGRGHGLLRRWRPDLVVATSLVAAPPAWLLSRRYRLPWVLYVYGSDLLHPGRLYGAATRFLLRRAPRIGAISASTAALLEPLGVPPARVAVLHPGVVAPPDEPVSDPAAAELVASVEGRRVLLSVGRLVKRKGLLEFVDRVMPGLVRRIPDSLLLVVGEDAGESLVHREGMRARIEQAVRERELEQHVRLLGRLPDASIQALYRRADLFVMPGLEVRDDIEGFGIVVLEAALAGVPTLGTRTGGISEAIVHGETGWLVPPGDPAALEEAAARLLEDAALRRRLGEAARRRARDEYSWEAVAARHLALFRDALGDARESPEPSRPT